MSVHRLEAEYDVGAVLSQARLRIGERTSWQLARALDRPSLRELRRVVSAHAQGAVPVAEPQDESLATSAPEPSGALLRADFGWTSARVLRRVRALSPVPGLALELGGARFLVTAATAAAAYTAALHPGEAEIRSGRLLLRTGDGAIQVERAELERPDAPDEEPRAVSGEHLARHLAERLESR